MGSLIIQVMKLVIFSALALTIAAMPGGHATGDDHAHDVVEGGDHGVAESEDGHLEKGHGENDDMEHSDEHDMKEYGHGKGRGKGEKEAMGNDGIVINNNVGGGCDMSGIAERVARQVVQIMMEHQKHMMEEMDAEDAGNEKKGKNDKKNKLGYYGYGGYGGYGYGRYGYYG